MRHKHMPDTREKNLFTPSLKLTSFSLQHFDNNAARIWWEDQKIMILNYNFYNASDFTLKVFRRVRFWSKTFTTRQILKKSLILKSLILKKKLFLKSTILKKTCIQKIKFWFSLPRKMRKFCVLRALLKCTILKKTKILQNTISKKKSFLKSMILSEKNFVSSDFVSSFLQRVRFGIKNKTTRQILKRKSLSKSTTCTFPIGFFHLTMYSYRLQHPRQLDNSNHLRSYNTFCTLFRKKFHFWFRYVVPLSFLILLDICKNQLLLIVRLQQLIQFLSHTCLTRFWKRLW